ncbi:MAG: orotidine-5'-phosphate decarboxylase [Pyrinomonadaceae bacterium]
MIKPTAAETQAINPRDRIIVALDVDSASSAREICRELSGAVGAFKIGLQLFTATGPAFVRELTESGTKIFLDLKFHDIPNTVAKAAVEAARLGLWMFNVHAFGGSEMMLQTIKEVDAVCETEEIARPLIIAVTVLTSSTAKTMSEIGVEQGINDQVELLAKLAANCGLDGIVASPQEAQTVRYAVDKLNFLIVTPGIRQTLATMDDQRRVTTIGQALAIGSDYVVIGRPIVNAKDRRQAVEQIVADV